jgi:hypothetical protein
LAAEAPVIPALLCIPGSPHDAPSKEAVPKLQDQRAVPMASLYLEGGMGVGQGLLKRQAILQNAGEVRV